MMHLSTKRLSYNHQKKKKLNEELKLHKGNAYSIMVNENILTELNI